VNNHILRGVFAVLHRATHARDAVKKLIQIGIMSVHSAEWVAAMSIRMVSVEVEAIHYVAAVKKSSLEPF
jgi:hypothetical protein